MEKTNPATLLAHGLHLGHAKQKLYPKARKYIHKIDKGIAIIDLFQTAALLDTAKEYIAQIAKEGKTLLVVATKKSARESVPALCKENNVPYMTNKWVGGLITNFSEISKNIKRMNEMREEQATEAWKSLPKHERTALEKKLNRIASIYTGVEKLEKAPDAVFIVDIKKEKNALTEALQVGIKTIAVVDTNVNPDMVDYPIPANDDAVLSIKYLAEEIVNTYIKNYKEPQKIQDTNSKKQTA